MIQSKRDLLRQEFLYCSVAPREFRWQVKVAALPIRKCRETAGDLTPNGKGYMIYQSPGT